jgi:hypothetical protein
MTVEEITLGVVSINWVIIHSISVRSFTRDCLKEIFKRCFENCPDFEDDKDPSSDEEVTVNQSPSIARESVHTSRELSIKF